MYTIRLSHKVYEKPCLPPAQLLMESLSSSPTSAQSLACKCNLISRLRAHSPAERDAKMIDFKKPV